MRTRGDSPRCYTTEPSPMIWTFCLTQSRPPVVRLLIALSALVLLGACRPRGSDLAHEEGLDRNHSAAVANQATAPERDDAAPGNADFASADDSRLQGGTGGPEPAGVQYGFSDASGGHSLPHTVQAGEGAENRSDAAMGNTVEQRVREAIAQMPGLGLTEEQKAAVDVQVEEDRVVLRGSVPDQRTGEALVDRVRSLRGVERVENELEVEATQPAE